MTHISRVEVANVRCHRHLGVEFSPGVNVLVGGNGVGKTSILESVALVMTGRSPRASSLKGMIRQGEGSMRIDVWLSLTEKVCAGEYPAEERLGGGSGRPLSETWVAAGYGVGGERRFFFNGGQVEDGRRLQETAHVRAFLPDDLRLVKGGPAPRRELLDALAEVESPEHRLRLDRYRRALEQRNALLRQGRLGDEHCPWEAVLADEGRSIMETRVAVLAGFAPFFAEVVSELGPSSSGPVKLLYRTNAEGLSEQEYRQRLASLRAHDARRTFTHLGPHRDDLRFVSAALDVREHGSQGEQRAVVLSLLLAEVRWLEQREAEAGLPVVLLLDDVLSELDDHRRRVLGEMLRGGVQSFLTTTDTQCLDQIHHDSVLTIEVSGGA
jgi:DNA replication and repair protein RecF